MEFSEETGRYGKITLPPGFGLVPQVRQIPAVDLRAEPGAAMFRDVIEFFPATPLEYLARWKANNDIFGDDVHLVSVIAWNDGRISFGITQPQYHGEPAEPREIERHFRSAGWMRLNDPSGHVVYFNHAFNVMAIDVEGGIVTFMETVFFPLT